MSPIPLTIVLIVYNDFIILETAFVYQTDFFKNSYVLWKEVEEDEVEEVEDDGEEVLTEVEGFTEPVLLIPIGDPMVFFIILSTISPYFSRTLQTFYHKNIFHKN